MTVSTEVTRVIVEGNGVTTTFSYSFPIPGSSATDQTNAELILLAADGTTTVLADNLWSITGVEGASGTFVYNPGSPVTTGNFLTLSRIVPYEQTTTLSAQGAYSPAVVEAALDNLAFQTEQLNTWRLQSLRAPITDAALSDLPTEVLRANRYLAFDTNGQATVSGVLNTASGFLIVGTQSANFLAPASVLNFVNAVTAVETVSGRVDITITGAAAGSPGQVQYNNSGALGGFTMSGDVTLTIPTGTASLSTTGVTAATYTAATITVDAKGRISSASSNAGGSFRGALLKITSDKTLGSGNQVISWDATVYDTDSIYNYAAHPTRLTVPSGVTKVRITGGTIYNGTAALTALYYKYNGAVPTIPFSVDEPVLAAAGGWSISGPVIAVSANDYFELNINTGGGVTLDGTTNPSGNYFGMEIVQ